MEACVPEFFSGNKPSSSTSGQPKSEGDTSKEQQIVLILRGRVYDPKTQCPAAVGACEQLGCWDPARAVRAKSKDNFLWKAVVTIPGNVTTEWKWAIIRRDTGEVLQYEGRSSRKLHVRGAGQEVETWWDIRLAVTQLDETESSWTVSKWSSPSKIHQRKSSTDLEWNEKTMLASNEVIDVQVQKKPSSDSAISETRKQKVSNRYARSRSRKTSRGSLKSAATSTSTLSSPVANTSTSTSGLRPTARSSVTSTRRNRRPEVEVATSMSNIAHPAVTTQTKNSDVCSRNAEKDTSNTDKVKRSGEKKTHCSTGTFKDACSISSPSPTNRTGSEITRGVSTNGIVDVDDDNEATWIERSKQTDADMHTLTIDIKRPDSGKRAQTVSSPEKNKTFRASSINQDRTDAHSTCVKAQRNDTSTSTTSIRQNGKDMATSAMHVFEPGKDSATSTTDVGQRSRDTATSTFKACKSAKDVATSSSYSLRHRRDTATSEKQPSKTGMETDSSSADIRASERDAASVSDCGSSAIGFINSGSNVSMSSTYIHRTRIDTATSALDLHGAKKENTTSTTDLWKSEDDEGIYIVSVRDPDKRRVFLEKELSELIRKKPLGKDTSTSTTVFRKLITSTTVTRDLEDVSTSTPTTSQSEKGTSTTMMDEKQAIPDVPNSVLVVSKSDKSIATSASFIKATSTTVATSTSLGRIGNDVSTSTSFVKESGVEISTSTTFIKESGVDIYTSTSFVKESGVEISTSTTFIKESGVEISTSTTFINESGVEISTSTSFVKESGVEISTSTSSVKESGVEISTSTTFIKESGVEISTSTTFIKESGVEISTSTTFIKESGVEISTSSSFVKESGVEMSTSTDCIQASGVEAGTSTSCLAEHRIDTSTSSHFVKEIGHDAATCTSFLIETGVESRTPTSIPLAKQPCVDSATLTMIAGLTFSESVIETFNATHSPSVTDGSTSTSRSIERLRDTVISSTDYNIDASTSTADDLDHRSTMPSSAAKVWESGETSTSPTSNDTPTNSHFATATSGTDMWQSGRDAVTSMKIVKGTGSDSTSPKLGPKMDTDNATSTVWLSGRDASTLPEKVWETGDHSTISTTNTDTPERTTFSAVGDDAPQMKVTSSSRSAIKLPGQKMDKTGKAGNKLPDQNTEPLKASGADDNSKSGLSMKNVAVANSTDIVSEDNSGARNKNVSPTRGSDGSTAASKIPDRQTKYSGHVKLPGDITIDYNILYQEPPENVPVLSNKGYEETQNDHGLEQSTKEQTGPQVDTPHDSGKTPSQTSYNRSFENIDRQNASYSVSTNDAEESSEKDSGFGSKVKLPCTTAVGPKSTSKDHRESTTQFSNDETDHSHASVTIINEENGTRQSTTSSSTDASAISTSMVGSKDVSKASLKEPNETTSDTKAPVKHEKCGLPENNAALPIGPIHKSVTSPEPGREMSNHQNEFPKSFHLEPQDEKAKNITPAAPDTVVDDKQNQTQKPSSDGNPTLSTKTSSGSINYPSQVKKQPMPDPGIDSMSSDIDEEKKQRKLIILPRDGIIFQKPRDNVGHSDTDAKDLQKARQDPQTIDAEEVPENDPKKSRNEDLIPSQFLKDNQDELSDEDTAPSRTDEDRSKVVPKLPVDGKEDCCSSECDPLDNVMQGLTLPLRKKSVTSPEPGREMSNHQNEFPKSFHLEPQDEKAKNITPAAPDTVVDDKQNQTQKPSSDGNPTLWTKTSSGSIHYPSQVKKQPMPDPGIDSMSSDIDEEKKQRKLIILPRDGIIFQKPRDNVGHSDTDAKDLQKARQDPQTIDAEEVPEKDPKKSRNEDLIPSQFLKDNQDELSDEDTAPSRTDEDRPKVVPKLPVDGKEDCCSSECDPLDNVMQGLTLPLKKKRKRKSNSFTRRLWLSSAVFAIAAGATLCAMAWKNHKDDILVFLDEKVVAIFRNKCAYVFEQDL